MKLDADDILLSAIRDGMRDGIKAKMSAGYPDHFAKLIETAIARHRDSIADLISDSIASLMLDATFRESMKSEIHTTVAKQLVQKFGGELEKQINALRSDPTTRAKITLAISNIVTGT